MSARWRYLIQEALVGLRRNLLMTAAVIMSVTVSLTLVGASLLLRDQVSLAAGDWTGKIEVSIFLCDGSRCPSITDEQRQELGEELRADPVVAEVFFESKDEAYQRFREQFKDQPDLVETVSPDTLPASYRVKLEDPEQFAAIRDRFEAWPGVEEIIDQRELLEDFLRFADVIKWSAVAIALVQLVAAMVLIANTIRVAAFARRDQTAIMKLVGASNWYVRLPFVLEGVLAAAVGAAVAWGVLLVAVPLTSDWLRSKIEFIPFIGWTEAVAVGPLLILIGVAVAALSSMIALRRFLQV